MVRIVVVEDNRTIREGLKILINQAAEFKCVSVYSKCEEIIKDIERLQADVVLVDIHMPGIGAIEGIKEIKKRQPDLTILVLSAYEENDIIFKAICSGASGFLIKKTPPQRLLEVIKEAYESSTPMNSQIAKKVTDFFDNKRKLSMGPANSVLTKREKEILGGLIEGSSFKVIADSLHTNIEAIRLHSKNIYKKLHNLSRREAVRI